MKSSPSDTGVLLNSFWHLYSGLQYFNLRNCKSQSWTISKPGQVMVHVLKDHVNTSIVPIAICSSKEIMIHEHQTKLWGLSWQAEEMDKPKPSVQKLVTWFSFLVVLATLNTSSNDS